MPEFKKNRFDGPRRPFNKGGGRPFDARSQGPRELFDAECSNCHARCQVPFRPNGKKPVFCSNCFNQDDERREQPRFEKREFKRERTDFAPRTPAPDPRIEGLRRQMDAIQASLEKLVSLVESSNRAAELTKEVRRHVQAEKPATAPKKVAPKKTVAKKTPKKAATKTKKKS